MLSPKLTPEAKRLPNFIALIFFCAAALGCLKPISQIGSRPSVDLKADSDELFLKAQEKKLEEFKIKSAASINLFKREASALQPTKEDEPINIGGYFYSLGEPPARDYPILLRSKRKRGPRDEVLDFNPILRGYPGAILSAARPNNSGSLAAFILDLGDSAGRRLFVANLGPRPEALLVAERVHDFAFAPDDISLAYTAYEGRRPAHLFIFDGKKSVDVFQSKDKSTILSIFKAADGGILFAEAGPDSSNIYSFDFNSPLSRDPLKIPGRVMEVSAQSIKDLWALNQDGQIFHADLPGGASSRAKEPKDFAAEHIRSFPGGAAIFGRWGGDAKLMLASKKGSSIRASALPSLIGEVWPSEDSAEGGRLSFFFSGPESPRTRLYLDLTSGQIFGEETPLPSSARTRSIKCGSGTQNLSAIYTGPEKPEVLLISAYGAYGRSQSLRYDPAKAAFTKLGIGWAFAQIRGGGEFGSEWRKSGEGKSHSIEDLRAIGQCLRATLHLAPKNVFLRGQSAGGFIVLSLMLRYPDEFGGVIADAPLTELELFAKMPDELNSAIESNEWGLGSGPDGVPSPATLISNKKYPPLLLVARVKDEIIPFDAVLRFAKKFRASGAEMLLAAERDGRHSSASLSTQAIEYAFIESLKYENSLVK